MDCLYQHVESLEDGRHAFVCLNCEHPRTSKYGDPAMLHRTCGKSEPKYCRAGCQLNRLLSNVGIEYTPDCKCASRAVEMDRNGEAWCRANIDTITGWMREEAENRGLPFVEFAAKQLVRLAIRLAEREAQAASRPR